MENRRMSHWAIRRCSSSRQGVCGTPGGFAPRSSGGSPAIAWSKFRCACPPPSRSSRCARSWSAWPMSVPPLALVGSSPARTRSLPKFSPRNKAPEGPRGVLQALHDVLLVPDLPLLEPPRDVPQEVNLAPRVVRDDAALDQRPLDQQRPRVGAGRRLGGVVLRDQAHQRDAGAAVDPSQDRLQHRPADVIVVDVDPAGAGAFERSVEVRRLVVDTTERHFAPLPATPTARPPWILAIWPTTEPTAPEAAETTTVWPGCGRPRSSRAT